jgi:uncharacterized protein YndB with AHSA1/START domain
MSPFATAEATVDARVGGAFTIVMLGQGQSIRHTGTFLELDAPRRLVFTWASPYTGDEPSIVSVSLAPAGDGTELVLIHDRLPLDQVQPHRGGWGSMLDHLSTLLESEARTSGRHG